jgi:hypothetical protein
MYLFLEPPHPYLWTIIKPIMSHDSFVIEHPYVESNTREGIHVKPIIVSRSMVMSPNMSPRDTGIKGVL